MKLSQIGAILIASLAVVLGFQNCGKAVSSSNASSTGVTASSDSLMKVLVEVNNRNLSCALDSDCIAVAVGAKACGGPSGYVVASKANPEIDQVQVLADEVTRQAREENVKSGLASTCSYEMPPDVSCVADLCVGSSPGSAPAQ